MWGKDDDITVNLRPILPSDRERMLDILTDHTVKQTYMLPDYKHREDAIPLLCRLMDMSGDTSKYVRAIAGADGLVGFVNHVEICGDSIELGYVIHPDFQGQGYMTKALGLAMEELFALGYRRITAGAFETNGASIRVMHKAGMHPLEKTDTIPYRGKIHRCIYFAIEKQE